MSRQVASRAASELLQDAYRAQQAGQLGPAEAIYRRLLEGEPRNAAAYHGLGLVLRDLGRYDAAVAALQRAVELNPSGPNAWYNLGRLYMTREAAVKACACFERAVGLRPDWLEARLGWAITLIKNQQAVRAEELLRETARLAPDNPHVAVLTANALLLQGRTAEVGPFLEQAAVAMPGYPELLLMQTCYARALGELDLARSYCEQLVTTYPTHEHGRVTLALIALEQHDCDAAIPLMRAAVEACPRGQHAAYFDAWATYLGGDERDGWRRFRRWLHLKSELEGKTLALPHALEDLVGRTVLLDPEQGLGDSLNYVRYAAALGARGVRIVLRAVPALRSLLAESLPGITVVGDDVPVPRHDLRLPEMALPVLFGSWDEAVPPPVRLVADPHDRAVWEARLGGGPDRRIGLVWAGNPSHFNDSNRSLAVDALRPLLDLPGHRFFSLQVGARSAEAAALGDRVTDLSPALNDFAQTAAALSALDLLIAVDTSIVHLAGNMGVPCWMLLANAPDWRWGRTGETTPWYPSLRLFRQERARDWATVISRVGAALGARPSNDFR